MVASTIPKSLSRIDDASFAFNHEGLSDLEKEDSKV